MVPQAKLYAKGTAYEFLKRVELRSSLLVEAGHQKEGFRAVPFYQFRHLTFQEYLAAVAVVEGHYRNYSNEQSVLDALGRYIDAEEWKEVVPMAAVLARKRSEPLFRYLNNKCANAFNEWNAELMGRHNSEKYLSTPKVDAASLLLKCLADEAEAAPSTISESLRWIVLYTRLFQFDASWRQIASGPYGRELRDIAWELLKSEEYSRLLWLRNSFAAAAQIQFCIENGDDFEKQIQLLIVADSAGDEDLVAKALLTINGLVWGGRPFVEKFESMRRVRGIVEKYIKDEESLLVDAALWTWGLMNRHGEVVAENLGLLDTLVKIYERVDSGMSSVSFALDTVFGIPRSRWMPSVSENVRVKIINELGEIEKRHDVRSALCIAFYARDSFDDRIIVDALLKVDYVMSPGIERVVAQLNMSDDERKRILERAPTRESREGRRKKSAHQLRFRFKTT